MSRRNVAGEKTAFVVSAIFLSMILGFSLAAFQLFPYPQIKALKYDLKVLLGDLLGQRPWYYFDVNIRPDELRWNVDLMEPGALTLITRVVTDRRVDAILVNAEREIIHRWKLGILSHWPEPDTVPADSWPKKYPGAMIHGAAVQENGDLIFNYERYGLMRVDVCSNPVWRLKKYATHHSVTPDDNGDFWVSGKFIHDQTLEWFPNSGDKGSEQHVIKVSPDGEVLDAISIPALLLENGYRGLLYVSSVREKIMAEGDLMHLNDVEAFPASMEPGFFRPGDIVVSLRNMSTVFVFNVDTRKIKFISTGQVLRQHDPDFFDGDRLSILDNNIVVRQGQNKDSSRIVLLSARDRSTEVVFPTDGETFVTRAQGKHQWLENGHLLVTESQRGRAIEVTTSGEIVWEYVNYVDNGWVGLITEATRLPQTFTADKFATLAARCN